MPAVPPPFELTMAREAFGTAAALHGRATREGADKLRDVDFDRLRAADATYAEALRHGRIQEAIDADEAFHAVLVEASGDPDLRVSVALLAPRLRRMDLWFFTRKAFGAAPNSHPEILAALERGDAETAAELVEASFLRAGDTLAEALSRAGSE